MILGVGTFGYSWYIGIMERNDLPKLDKTAFSVTSLLEPHDEKQYWLKKTPYERLAAVETMRMIIYGYNPLTTRLQRLLEVTKHS